MQQFEKVGENRLREFGNDILIFESVRFIKRIRENASIDIEMWNSMKSYIDFPDLIIFEYVKLKMPYMMNFFNKTTYRIIDETMQFKMHMKNLLDNNERNTENKLIDIVKEFNPEENHQIIDKNKEKILIIIRLLAYFYINWLENRMDDVSIATFNRTSSNPDSFFCLLRLDMQNEYKNRIEYLYELDEIIDFSNTMMDKKVGEISNNTLITFTSNYIDQNAQKGKIKIVIKELINRLLKVKIPFKRDTGFFQKSEQDKIMDFILKSMERKINNTNDAKKIFHKNVKSYLKIRLLKEMIKLIHIKINSSKINDEGLFREISDYYNIINTNYKKTISEIKNRYFYNGKQNVFIEEENPYYIINNYRSGIPDKKEINKIQKAIFKYNYNEDILIELWNELDKNRSFFNESNMRFLRSESIVSFNECLTIENLIKITKQQNTTNKEIIEIMEFWNKPEQVSKWKEIIKDWYKQNKIESTLIYEKKYLDILMNIITELNNESVESNINYLVKLKKMPRIMDTDFNTLLTFYNRYIINKAKEKNILKKDIIFHKYEKAKWEDKEKIINNLSKNLHNLIILKK